MYETAAGKQNKVGAAALNSCWAMVRSHREFRGLRRHHGNQAGEMCELIDLVPAKNNLILRNEAASRPEGRNYILLDLDLLDIVRIFQSVYLDSTLIYLYTERYRYRYRTQLFVGSARSPATE
ncbi:hypothetical protein PVAR5_8266 [Paecilomyces variotii No. 5]|uniref:Uncharacterized protein n=1 Tax=Byssochlamys spectabilis (strain No. 5 / NBRC 109023) TaxID=1356009 RepID=V5GBW7_BYSSN|nr:hypothetical protein PVAR5_8266 [Paecilomyces variotii No. 5]